MSTKGEGRWSGVSMPKTNALGFASLGGKYINEAISQAQGGISAHQKRLDENAKSAEMQATAKLAELAKANGGKLTQKDKDSVGFFDAMKLQNLMENQEQATFDRMNKDRDFNLRQRNVNSQIADRGGKLDPLSKMMAKFKIDKELYDYKEKNKGSGTKIDNILKENNIIYDPFDSSLSTADGDNFAEYRTTLTALAAKGVKTKDIKAAVAANSKSGGFWGQVGPWDEQTLDIQAVIKHLEDAGYTF